MTDAQITHLVERKEELMKKLKEINQTIRKLEMDKRSITSNIHDIMDELERD